MTLSFPSKTFLIGEYAVLNSSPAVLVNTLPRFEFNIHFNSSSCRHPFHKDSCSARWIKINQKLFSNISISCFDPHQGQGGCGLSGAEFNCVYFIKNKVKNVQLLNMWKEYNLLKTGSSGADIVSQWVGNVCLFNPYPFSVRSLTWPFKNLSFALIRTGQKLKTWKYLKNLKKNSFPDLNMWARQAFQAVESSDEESFIRAIKEYAVALDKNGLVMEPTQYFLEKLKKNKDIVTAKGCGAMGAEVVVLFFQSCKEEKVMKFLENNEIVSTSHSITHGISIKNKCS